MDSFTIEDLKNLLEAALESEDYESAAELRDAIKGMEKNNK
jgi:protein-arginine kinase activator protein McsA